VRQLASLLVRRQSDDTEYENLQAVKAAAAEEDY
jgi:hypothetical protein